VDLFFNVEGFMETTLTPYLFARDVTILYWWGNDLVASSSGCA
jgi:hypothetical protein